VLFRSQIIASSLRTVNTHLVIDFLDEYVKNENIEKFVIGLPKQKDNSNTFKEVKIKKFILKHKAKFPLIQIQRYDERFTFMGLILERFE
jgi:putative Holliday junction resolvase